MKKLLSLTLNVILLFSFAFSVKAAGGQKVVIKEDLNLSFQIPQNWKWATRQMQADNPVLALNEMDAEEYLTYLQQNGLYFEAYGDVLSNYFNISCYRADPNQWGESFANLEQEELVGYANVLLNLLADTQYADYQNTYYADCKNNTFIIFEHYNQQNGLLYFNAYSVYQEKLYHFSMAGLAPLDQSPLPWWGILESVRFGIHTLSGFSVILILIGIIGAIYGAYFFTKKLKK